MKKILTVTLLMLSVSCAQQDSRNPSTTTVPAKDTIVEKPYSYEHSSGMWSSIDYMITERTIDSCEYIIIFGSEGRNIIHKANCNNPFHGTQH